MQIENLEKCRQKIQKNVDRKNKKNVDRKVRKMQIEKLENFKDIKIYR